MADNIVEVDEFRPNYQVRCMNCNATPTVEAIKRRRVIYKSELCGPCLWGEARTIDPKTWNE